VNATLELLVKYWPVISTVFAGFGWLLRGVLRVDGRLTTIESKQATQLQQTQEFRRELVAMDHRLQKLERDPSTIDLVHKIDVRLTRLEALTVV